MGWGDNPVLPQSIREGVERARAKAPPPGPDPVPRYLACVYREVSAWRESNEWASVQTEIQNYYIENFHPKIVKDYFRFIIELTAGKHVSPQEKSKYVEVLNYAQRLAVPRNKFIKFLKDNGGIKGCIKDSKGAGPKKVSRGRPVSK
jgi:hypothetical protein